MSRATMSDGAAPSMQQSQAYFDKHTVQLQMGPPGGRPHMAAAAPAPKKHSCFRRTLAVIACVVIVGGIALLALVLAVTKDDAQAPEHTSTVAFRVRRAFADASRGGSRRLVQSVLAAGTVSQSATGAPTGGHVDSLALFVQEVYLCREVACDGTYAGDSTVTGAADQCTVGRVDIGTAWESHCVAVFKQYVASCVQSTPVPLALWMWLILSRAAYWWCVCVCAQPKLHRRWRPQRARDAAVHGRGAGELGRVDGGLRDG